MGSRSFYRTRALQADYVHCELSALLLPSACQTWLAHALLCSLLLFTAPQVVWERTAACCLCSLQIPAIVGDFKAGKVSGAKGPAP